VYSITSMLKQFLTSFIQRNPAVIVFLVLLGLLGPLPGYVTAHSVCLSEQGQPSCFYKQSPESKKLIIFVHGVFGSGATTWRDPNSRVSWPEMVSLDDRFLDHDIYLINYKSPYLGGAPNIHETGGIELERMLSRKVFQNYQEIYFIAHSMGGLVVKSMLTRLNHGEGDDVIRLRRVKGVMFLGTPAQGANLAEFWSKISMNPQIENMERAQFNAYLQSLEDQWIQLIEDRDAARGAFPKVYCAYETEKTFFSRVVARELAASRCDGGIKPMPLKHENLATPKSKDDDPYLWAMAGIYEAGVIAQERKESAKQGESADEVVHIDCQFGLMPTVIPPDGRNYILMTYPIPRESGGGGLAEAFGLPGSEQRWSAQNAGPATGYRCQLTNYGKSPMFNVEMVVMLSFREVQRKRDNPNALTSGVVTLSRGWLVPVKKIDSGPNNPFIFYIFNTSPQFVDVSLPKSVTYQKGDSEKRFTVTLKQAAQSFINLPPGLGF